MKTFWLLLLGGALLCSGCAGVAEFRLPEEFKGKKQVEDPPLSRLPRAERAAA